MTTQEKIKVLKQAIEDLTKHPHPFFCNVIPHIRKIPNENGIDKYRELKKLRLIEAMELCGGEHIAPPKKGEEMDAFNLLDPKLYYDYDYLGWKIEIANKAIELLNGE